MAANPFPLLPSESPSETFPPLGTNIKVLMVWPRFPPSFWGFEGVLKMIPEKATSPPLGLLTVAALCPPAWTIRLIDLAFEELRDEDLEWADLVMVSAMHAQRESARNILSRARRAGRRTFVGGPWASSDPDAVLPCADHVLVGEVEEVFPGIAAALEQGTAQKLYRISNKPDMTCSPVPRFDLLQLKKYTAMPVQFSRGCPFQCDFCDIITIYGRRPRTKTTGQVIAELETLHRLGWHNEVFIVDDNFIGNSKNALALTRELSVWQKSHDYPFAFYTEASIDLADRPELLATMVEANFAYVFIGIETPSPAALKESKKFQNLRKDNLQQVRVIHESGLWVLGGFIVGFDSDDETIFDRQLEFIERAAIPWAMAGVLQAPPTTPLYERMKREGRLIENSEAITNFSPPNFRPVLPAPVLLRGLSRLLAGLYAPEAYFRRSFRSLQSWRPRAVQRPVKASLWWNVRVLSKAVWHQGIRSSYRAAWWKFAWQLVRNYATDPLKLWLGGTMLLTSEHFLLYSRMVAEELEKASRAFEEAELSAAAAVGAQ